MTWDSKKFDLQEAPELDVQVLRCKRCKAVIDVSESEEHVCPDLAEREARRTDALKRAEIALQRACDTNLDIPIKERINLIDEHFALQESVRKEDAEHVVSLYGKFYHKVVMEAYDESIKLTQSYRQRIYEEYDKMRQKGVPFAERKKFLDDKQQRLDWSEKHERELVENRDRLYIVPLEQWLDEFDIERMKSKGFRYVVRDAVMFNRCYQFRK